MGEWIKKMLYTHTHTGILFTCQKTKDKMLPFATTWMDVESIIQSKIRQRKANTI